MDLIALSLQCLEGGVTEDTPALFFSVDFIDLVSIKDGIGSIVVAAKEEFENPTVGQKTLGPLRSPRIFEPIYSPIGTHQGAQFQRNCFPILVQVQLRQLMSERLFQASSLNVCFGDQ